jgi:Na+-transporting NADH:ubiquinone oxidoreductase subunit NqrB
MKTTTSKLCKKQKRWLFRKAKRVVSLSNSLLFNSKCFTLTGQGFPFLFSIRKKRMGFLFPPLLSCFFFPHLSTHFPQAMLWVYFRWQEFILGLQAQFQPRYSFTMRRLREHIHWLNLHCLITAIF